jgi:hypothetical protein
MNASDLKLLKWPRYQLATARCQRFDEFVAGLVGVQREMTSGELAANFPAGRVESLLEHLCGRDVLRREREYIAPFIALLSPGNCEGGAGI